MGDITFIAWEGCYDESWKGLITDESFCHPAKFAPGLIKRILAHGLERGYWRKGETLGDPFGGIAGGGIMAGHAGLNYIGVELEKKFVMLSHRNIALNLRKVWCCGGQKVGDYLRCVREIIPDTPLPREAKQESFLFSGVSRQMAERTTDCAAEMRGVQPNFPDDNTPTEIVFNCLQESAREALLETLRRQAAGEETCKNCGRKLVFPLQLQGDSRRFAEIVAGVVTSPPYSESLNHGGGPSTKLDIQKGLLGIKAGYGESAGQIGGLPSGNLDGVATGPPYEHSIESRGDGIDWRKASRPTGATRTIGRGAIGDVYGEASGQIGAERGETYWQAMALVYRQCFLAIKPGGYMAVVVKNFVKNKKVVPLVDQTLQLLVSLGFEPVERIHAMLVKETTREGLFAPVTKKVSMKSLFRRISEKKGAPPIDWEAVLVVRKPAP